jgi:alkanesulfonate monooxygenase SsuD/methylene tetrahydromethanopterin reductase-like flavin-dependent oxidoreductase (luciferase family)
MTSEITGRLPIRFITSVSGPTFEAVLEQAQAAEAAGFDGITFSDRPHDPVMDGWTLAAAVAARTERVRLSHMTLNIPYRYPAVLAKEAATLDIVSQGRLDLCLGAGGEQNRHLYDSIGVPLASPADRVRALRECIEVLRGLWANERFSYDGRIYHLDDAAGGVQPVQDSLPIWVGALMPRTLRIAGRFADGFMKNRGWCTPMEYEPLNEAVTASAIEAGRYPNEIRRIINGAAYVARDPGDARAYQERGSGIGGFTNTGLVGTVDEILDIVRAYRSVGVDTFGIRFPAGQVVEQMRRFGAEVIPEAAKLL